MEIKTTTTTKQKHKATKTYLEKKVSEKLKTWCLLMYALEPRSHILKVVFQVVLQTRAENTTLHIGNDW